MRTAFRSLQLPTAECLPQLRAYPYKQRPAGAARRADCIVLRASGADVDNEAAPSKKPQPRRFEPATERPAQQEANEPAGPGPGSAVAGQDAAVRRGRVGPSRLKTKSRKPQPEQATGRASAWEGKAEESTSFKRFEKLELDESDPMYTPALTDEDLEQDPPGHKSGYVAVIGKPNAGKSTLINAIVGQKLSIVSYKPQTTRHRIVGIASAPEYQMILFDTPGIIEKKRNKLEERMMAAVVTSIQNAEAIIAVVDSKDQPKEALAMFQPGDNWTGPPMAVLLNKADLMSQEELSEVETWYKEACKAEAVYVGSAMNNEGVEQIKAWAVSKMPEGPTLYPKGIVSEQPERFFVAELIREKIFYMYEQEVPYCVQVQIKEFKERRRGNKDLISAEILVEKASQMSILIGKGGSALKKLGSAAREEIESFLERPVYLELSVQLAENWRTSKDALSKYGYYDALYI